MKSKLQQEVGGCDRKATRRNMLKTAGLGGLSLAAMHSAPVAAQVEYTTQNVRRSSRPSDLKITDLRIAFIHRAPMRVPIIRIPTDIPTCVSGNGKINQ